MKAIMIQRCTSTASCKKVKQKFVVLALSPPVLLVVPTRKGPAGVPQPTWSKIGPAANRLSNNTINTIITNH